MDRLSADRRYDVARVAGRRRSQRAFPRGRDPTARGGRRTWLLRRTFSSAAARRDASDMRYVLAALALIIVQLSSGPSVLAQSSTCGGMTVGQLTSLNGFVPFPSSSRGTRIFPFKPVSMSNI